MIKGVKAVIFMMSVGALGPPSPSGSARDDDSGSVTVAGLQPASMESLRSSSLSSSVFDPNGMEEGPTELLTRAIAAVQRQNGGWQREISLLREEVSQKEAALIEETRRDRAFLETLINKHGALLEEHGAALRAQNVELQEVQRANDTLKERIKVSEQEKKVLRARVDGLERDKGHLGRIVEEQGQLVRGIMNESLDLRQANRELRRRVDDLELENRGLA